MAQHKKTFSVDVSDEVSEAFSAQVTDRGYTKYRAFEAALRAFMAIPPEAQVLLMSNNANAKDILTRIFRDISFQEDLMKLPPEKQAQIVALAKEVAKQFSRKK